MDTKIIATPKYSLDYCIYQIELWTNIYNYMDDLIEMTEDIALIFHFVQVQEHIADVMENWIYEVNKYEQKSDSDKRGLPRESISKSGMA